MWKGKTNSLLVGMENSMKTLEDKLANYFFFILGPHITVFRAYFCFALREHSWQGSGDPFGV